MREITQGAPCRDRSFHQACGVLTTFTVFSCAPGAGWWALKRMGSARPRLRGVPGLRFGRMLGMGRRFGGFSPDLGRYALLCVWDDEAAAGSFLRDSPFMADWRARAAPSTSFLRTLGSVGTWDGERPFGASGGGPRVGATVASGPVAVLTRATVRPWRQLTFWRHASAIERAMQGAAGLRLAVPVGELPLLRSGTFTIWDDARSLARFVHSEAHRRAMAARREQAWYREELFARFAVLRSEEAGA